MLYGVILAAGNSTRMKTKEKKQFMIIGKKPIINYSIDKFLLLNKFDVIIVVINNKDKKSLAVNNIIKQYNKYIHSGKIIILLGGNERYDSVNNVLEYIKETFGIYKNDKILIHDAARPNVNLIDIKNILKCINKYKSITLGSKLSDTIKEVEDSKSSIKKVVKTIDRNKYYLIKTPQAFDLSLLYDAYKRFYKSKTKLKITDDIQIIEKFTKIKSYILDSSPLNLKITTKDDLFMLKYLL